MTEITDLSPTDSSNTDISGESLDGAIANMGRMDNTLQATMGMLARSIRTNVLRWIDGTDSTKRVALDLSGIPTATTRTWTAPYYSGTLGLVSNIIGYMNGLAVSANALDPTNDVDIAAGSAVDPTGAVSILLASAMGKRVDATWVAGGTPASASGGRFYTTLVDGTIYLYLIRNPTTGVVDTGFSDNATNPTGGASYPAGFTQYVLIGQIFRTGGVNTRPGAVGWRGTYSEGSFLPTVFGRTSAGVTTYGATREGRFTQIGRTVVIEISVNWTNATGTGQLAVGGFSQAPGMTGATAALYTSSLTLSPSHLAVGLMNTGVNSVPIYLQSTGGGAATSLAVQTSGEIRFSITFTV